MFTKKKNSHCRARLGRSVLIFPFPPFSSSSSCSPQLPPPTPTPSSLLFSRRESRPALEPQALHLELSYWQHPAGPKVTNYEIGGYGGGSGGLGLSLQWDSHIPEAPDPLSPSAAPLWPFPTLGMETGFLWLLHPPSTASACWCSREVRGKRRRAGHYAS